MKGEAHYFFGRTPGQILVLSFIDCRYVHHDGGAVLHTSLGRRDYTGRSIAVAGAGLFNRIFYGGPFQGAPSSLRCPSGMPSATLTRNSAFQMTHLDRKSR
jgi:hypothetical protein